MKNYIYLVTFILGTRPEAIKIAPVLKEFLLLKKFKVRIILTGQHHEMVYQILNLFQISADRDLKLMSPKQTLTHITCQSLYGLEEDFKKHKPDLVLVQGDTSTAFAGALAAFYSKIPIAHIEAGLRTKNKNSPYPEEINRRLISQLADLHFAPTKLAKDNLIKSGITKNVFVTGNTVIDALLKIAVNVNLPDIRNLDWDNNKVILVTVHRRENWGKNLEDISIAIDKLAKDRDDICFLIPMHKNKIVRETLTSKLSDQKNIFLTEPLNYDQLIGSIKKCYLVMTDSGGLQEEVPTFGKPVLVLRDNTEREEAIEAGTAKLIGCKTNKIIDEVLLLLEDKSIYNRMAKSINPFGDGKSSGRILLHCLEFLEKEK